MNNLARQVFSGELPFARLKDGAVLTQVALHDKRPPRPSEPATRRGLDDRIWSLIQNCWRTKPADRPDMSEVASLL